MGGGISAVVLWVGLTGLFLPVVTSTMALSVWLVGGLLLTCLAHSQLLISHQAWGVRLGGDDVQRSQVVAWREGHGLLGVVLASALSVVWGPETMLVALGLALLVGWVAWWYAPRPRSDGSTAGRDPVSHRIRVWQPLCVSAFRRLLAVFMCNGIASAVPAALMLFFAQDRLQASELEIAGLLVLYFLCAGVSIPFWLRAVRVWGLAWPWLVGMLLAVACFAWTVELGPRQVLTFAMVCAFTGAAMGADLTLPGALLARMLAQQGAQGRDEGAYIGWWNLATKLNLALAAGAALPALQWGGYVPGTQEATALQWLGWAYALVPCVLKLLAALLLYLLLIRRPPLPAPIQRCK